MKLLRHAALSLGAVVMMMPFLWMLVTALSDGGFANFAEAWNRVPFGLFFLNTIAITGLTVLGVLVTGSLAAYAFAMMEFPGRGVLFMLFLSTMMVPQPVYMAPSYVLLARMGWVDTYWALIVPWVANVFSIFLLRQHFKTIPRSLYEAAVLDGCSRLGYLWRVVLPLSRPVLATVVLFNTISSWNSFMWPLVMTHSEKLRVIQVGLSYFSQEMSGNYRLLMAASTFCTLPLLILYLVFQRQLVSSYAGSGLKD